jgi:hypothetical protein
LIKPALDVHHNGERMKGWRRQQPQKFEKGCLLKENNGSNLYLPNGARHGDIRLEEDPD